MIENCFMEVKFKEFKTQMKTVKKKRKKKIVEIKYETKA